MQWNWKESSWEVVPKKETEVKPAATSTIDKNDYVDVRFHPSFTAESTVQVGIQC
jgi:hypothetical protein